MGPGETIGHRPSGCSRDRAAPVVFLRKSGALFYIYTLEGVAELRGSHAYRLPKYLSEMTRASVADFERDFDEAAGCFADQLLSLQHAPGSRIAEASSPWPV